MKAKIIILGILIILGIRTTINLFSSQMIDFSAYIATANAFLLGQDPYFIKPLSLLYPPASLTLFIPFTLIPYQYAKTVWLILSLFALFLGLHLLFKKVTHKHPNLNTLSLEAIFILSAFQLFPTKFSLAQGQINSLVFLGLILLFQSINSKKTILTGLILSILVNIKLLPLFFILYFLLTKQTKVLLYFFFFYLSSNYILDLFSPIDLSSSFVSQTIHRTQNPPLYYYNQSLTAFLYRVGLENISFVVNLSLVAITALTTFLKPKQINKNLSLFLCCLLLISPITWQHYLFWTIPLFIYLVTQRMNTKTLPVLFLSFLLIDLNLRHPEIYSNNQLIYSHSTVGLVILFFLIILSDGRSLHETPRPIAS